MARREIDGARAGRFPAEASPTKQQRVYAFGRALIEYVPCSIKTSSADST